MPANLDIVASQEILVDPAVSAGIEDLEEALSEKKPSEGYQFLLEVSEDPIYDPGDIPEIERTLIADSCFEIRSSADGTRLVGGSALGLAYGLFELADRVRVNGSIPLVNEVVHPELPYRILCTSTPFSSTLEGPGTLTEDIERTRESYEKTLKRVLKHGFNIVTIRSSQDYFPQDIEIYTERSERYGKHLRAIIDLAHAYHLLIIPIGDEFTYLPEALERAGAKPSIKDEKLWEFLRAKYRSLFASFPDLDGAGTRIGEHIPYFGFSTLDVIHSSESEPDPRIEERYRNFIKTMHGVVSGEHDKLYLHRTWTVNVHEQHSVYQVYQATFTPEVPVENLLLAIKLTAGDQWYPCEPYNVTFGRTPHTTIAQGELYSGYQGRGTFIEYPARYFQAALEWAVDRNTRGIMTGLGSEGFTDDAITYVFSRLGWNPHCSVDELTVNWATKVFGREVAGDIARIFLLGSVAVRDGLYLRQPGLHNWEPIPHLRVNDFVVKGVPDLDNGRTHDEYLKGIYLQCKPWLEQTESELDHGEEVCREMIGIFEGCRDKIADESKAKALEKILHHGLATMKLNGGYAKAFLRYFKYRDEPTEASRKVLEGRLHDLEEAIADYRTQYDFYKMQGISAFLVLAKRAMDDLENAEKTLENSPTMDDLQTMFDRERENWEKRLDGSSESILVATWKGSVDGRDIIRIKEGKFTIEHIADDPIVSPQIWVHADFPRDRKYGVVIKPLDVPGNIHIREQPSAENDYTLTLYTEDRTPGRSVYLFEIHAIFE
jgi:hypothetical protein